jgi:repressor LexA
MAEPLTKRQKEVFDFVSQYIEVHGYAPSYREIATAFKFGSVATVAEHIESLVTKGMLQKGENEARSIQLVPQGVYDESNTVSLPIMGLVAAGQPIETLGGHTETLEVPPFMVGRRNSYVLEVKGQSMVDEGINDGDYVVVTEKEVPSNGDMIIAMVNNGGATLKRYYKEKGHIRLQPSNAAMDPIIIEPGTPIEIQGIVIGLIRKY